MSPEQENVWPELKRHAKDGSALRIITVVAVMRGIKCRYSFITTRAARVKRLAGLFHKQEP